MGRRLALLIATYDYQDTGLRRLTAPAHDAEAFAAVLEDPDIAGFEVTTLINEAHHRVGAAIGDLYRDRRRDDLTLLYFTGHGLKDEDGRLYLAMANTRRDSLLFTSLPAEQVDQAMSGCMSRQKVLILDCCYSGAFPAGRTAKADTDVHALERFQGRGRTVLTASDATQYSFEGSHPRGEAAQSVFTRYLVAGLRDGSADLDGDGNITLDELYSYVHDRVIDEMPQQRPKKQDNVEGRIVIARNINWTLPPYLSNALRSPIATDRLAALDGLAHLHRIGNNLVRQRVNGEIQRLVDDDSRLVSAAAAAQIQSIQPPETPGEPAASHVPDTQQPAVGPSTKTTESPAEKTLETPLMPTPAPPIPQAVTEAPDREHHSSPQQAFPTPPTVPPRGPGPAPPSPARPVLPGPGPIQPTSPQPTRARSLFQVSLVCGGLSLLPHWEQYEFDPIASWALLIAVLLNTAACTTMLHFTRKPAASGYHRLLVFHAVITVLVFLLLIIFAIYYDGSVNIGPAGLLLGLACAAQIYARAALPAAASHHETPVGQHDED
ncbi:caspase family protein [Streptomyces sp. NBC_00827]|uniref:caspase family protein n=1 Tax=Streptomyces sp. NBC_00827 TaxID=2903677 RepID=UPI003863E6D7|nr:caspase family protein [Streptomyces sp. NBC_00827]